MHERHLKVETGTLPIAAQKIRVEHGQFQLVSYILFKETQFDLEKLVIFGSKDAPQQDKSSQRYEITRFFLGKIQLNSNLTLGIARLLHSLPLRKHYL